MDIKDWNAFLDKTRNHASGLLYVTPGQLQGLVREIEQLRAENARLSQCLRWQQDRDATQSTHGPDCWQWGNRHYECALRENAELTRRMGLMREWMETIEFSGYDVWAAFLRRHPESNGWFP